MTLGLAYARLGQVDAALKQNEVAASLDRRSHGLGFEGQRRLVLARIQVTMGHASAAIDILAQLLAQGKNGYLVSPALLRIDPTLDPLRKDPRFQALLKKYANAAPAPAATTADRSPPKPDPLSGELIENTWFG